MNGTLAPPIEFSKSLNMARLDETLVSSTHFDFLRRQNDFSSYRVDQPPPDTDMLQLLWCQDLEPNSINVPFPSAACGALGTTSWATASRGRALKEIGASSSFDSNFEIQI